jgi:hypothetical protein
MRADKGLSRLASTDFCKFRAGCGAKLKRLDRLAALFLGTTILYKSMS